VRELGGHFLDDAVYDGARAGVVEAFAETRPEELVGQCAAAADAVQEIVTSVDGSE
jgi:hypothetical protein